MLWNIQSEYAEYTEYTEYVFVMKYAEYAFQTWLTEKIIYACGGIRPIQNNLNALGLVVLYQKYVKYV